MTSLLQWLRERLRRAPREHAEDTDNPSRLKPALTLAAVVLVVAAALWVVWSVPHRVVQRRIDAQHPLTLDKQLDLEDAYRKTITQIVLSVFGLYILYLSYRRAETGDKTVRIMEQGHITDRFTKAIEQLGKTDGDKPNIEVRLGAIYALERIAIDSERDHWTIMEVLTAYVRQNAPLRPELPCTEGEEPRTDIQAILTVLGRRRTNPKRERPNQFLDLSTSHLDGANLIGANLKHANFSNASMQKATFYAANLAIADFDKANLFGAFLMSTNLQNARLWRANLQSAQLEKANLSDAFLWETKLEHANLSQANLQSAYLVEACLQDANLYEADLRYSELNLANLQRANFTKANLSEADLGRANIQGTVLFDADLRGVSGLTVKSIHSAICWIDARYSPAFRAELGLPPDGEDQAQAQAQAPTPPTP